MAETSKKMVEDLYDMANLLRIHTIEMTEAANSGHPTTCSSIAEIMSVLFFHPNGMHYNPKKPKNMYNDRLILSKGHAAPILYAAWARAGYLDYSELLDIRKISSKLEGHPTPRLDFVDVATGSLGQGLGVACGMAYASKYLDKIDNRYFVIMGDGEITEGSVWEACIFASYYKLNNVIGIVDCNKYGQSMASLHGHDLDAHARKFEAFGFKTIKAKGHSIEDLIDSLGEARKISDAPVMILAETLKGKLFTEKVEDQMSWHGKPLVGAQSLETIGFLRSLIKTEDVKLEPCLPDVSDVLNQPQDSIKSITTDYVQGTIETNRVSYGKALTKLGETSKDIVVLDADTKKSTMSYLFENAFSDRFIECLIAEQNMISVAMGLSCRGKVTFSSSFGSFLTRTFDQMRMAAISQSNIKICGSHGGVSVGEDGPSQMGLEDLSMTRAVPNSTVLYPSDPVSCEKAVALAANTKGFVYIRTTRPTVPILYPNNEEFFVGQSKLLCSSGDDQLLIVAGGITTHEALKSTRLLSSQGIKVSIIDVFCVKPLDKVGILNAARKAGNKILVVEDHYSEGGLKEAVSSELSSAENLKIFGRSITSIPRSGKPDELLKFYKLDAQSIANFVAEIVSEK